MWLSTRNVAYESEQIKIIHLLVESFSQFNVYLLNKRMTFVIVRNLTIWKYLFLGVFDWFYEWNSERSIGMVFEFILLLTLMRGSAQGYVRLCSWWGFLGVFTVVEFDLKRKCFAWMLVGKWINSDCKKRGRAVWVTARRKPIESLKLVYVELLFSLALLRVAAHVA